jgi:hypothetical protein
VRYFISCAGRFVDTATCYDSASASSPTVLKMSPEFGQWLDIADKVLTVIILVGGFLGFIFRAWISEWIKHRFSRAVGEELEQQKHKLNRDLEAYKGSLLRELEEIKANIDIKRSIALKMAETRLDALRVLAFAFDECINEAVTMAGTSVDLRMHNLSTYNKSMEESRNARRSAEIFLPPAMVSDIVNTYLAASTLVAELMNSNAVLAIGDQRIQNLIAKSASVSMAIRDQIHADPVLPRSA